MTRIVPCLLVAMTLACGTPAPAEAPAEPPAPPTVAPPDDQAMAEAEQRARAAWFPFELTRVETELGGDWIAFERMKRAEEEALARDWRRHAGDYESRFYRLRSPEAVRGARVLQQEFDQVARERTDELRERAAGVLAHLAAGRLEEVARDCTFYGGPDREALCLARLREQAAALAAAAAAFNPAVGFDSIAFESPEPAAGMVGQATLSFGPALPAPAGAGDRYPSRHQVELWWSGQVMPEANGPVHHAPVTPGADEGRWRFYDVVLPYSRTPSLRQ